MNVIPLMATVRQLAPIIAAAGLSLLAGCTSARNPSEAVLPICSASSSYYPLWMAMAAYAPVFRVLDTESSLGPFAQTTKCITLEDLIKMHGHPCDGLVTAACACPSALGACTPMASSTAPTPAASPTTLPATAMWPNT